MAEGRPWVSPPSVNTWRVVSGVLLSSALPGTVHAAEVGAVGTPAAYAKRGLTLRQGQLRLDAAPPDFALLDSGARNDDRALLSFARREFGDFDETFVKMGVGLGYGVLDDLELGALLLPILLSPNGEFGDMEFYGRYRFVRGETEVGAQFGVSLPTNTENVQANFALTLGVPLLVHLSRTTRLDVGAEFEIILGDADGVVNLDMPAALQFQVGDVFFVGPKAGVFLVNMEEIELGLGVVTGITIARSRGAPVFDILGEFYWPFFLSSGREDAVNADQFNLLFGVRVFFSLLGFPR